MSIRNALRKLYKAKKAHAKNMAAGEIVRAKLSNAYRAVVEVRKVEGETK